MLHPKQLLETERGVALLIGIVTTLFLFALSGSVGNLANSRAKEYRHRRARQNLLYIGERGVAQKVQEIKDDGSYPIPSIPLTYFPDGQTVTSYEVLVDDDKHPGFFIDPDYIRPGGGYYTGDVTLTAFARDSNYNLERRVKVKLSNVHPLALYSIYTSNRHNSPFNYYLGGLGPTKDTVLKGSAMLLGAGGMYIRGNVIIDPAPVGSHAKVEDVIHVTGAVQNEGDNQVDEATAVIPPFYLEDMEWATRNDYDVADCFEKLGINSGPLPSDHPLRHLFVKNPTDRTTECNDTTDGDDFFLEDPDALATGGSVTLYPKDLKVYYVDGHLWIHNYDVETFRIADNKKNRVTIVATKGIHILDGIIYGDPDEDAVLLVSLADIEFGDPSYDPAEGYVREMHSLMVAGNNFIEKNSNGPGDWAAVPFTIIGLIAAENKIEIQKQWSQPGHPNHPKADRWNNMDHGQIIIEYDDALLDPTRRPRMAPEGPTDYMIGPTNWQEVYSQELP